MFSAAQVRRRHQQWIRRVESLLANRDRIEAKDSLAAVNRRCRHRSSNRRPERYIICHTQKKSLGYDSVMEESNRWNSSTVASSSPGFIFFFLSPPPRRSLPYYSHANTFFFFTKSQGNYAKVLRNLHAEQLSKVQWKHQQECELLEDLRYTLSLICKWFYKCTQKTLYIHEPEAYVLVVADELLANWLELFFYLRTRRWQEFHQAKMRRWEILRRGTTTFTVIIYSLCTTHGAVQPGYCWGRPFCIRQRVGYRAVRPCIDWSCSPSLLQHV